jgi:ABC-type sugar transport system substrate-binding protein
MKFKIAFFCYFLFILPYQNVSFSKPNDTSHYKKTKILLTIPSPDSFPFWWNVKQLSSLVSEKLGVELYILNFEPGDSNRFQSAKALEKTITSTFKPDFIIGMFWMNRESSLLDIIEKHKIPFISFNSSITGEQFSKVGLPGDKYLYWLAHIAPDDIAVGKTVAQRLITTIDHGTMIAIAGDRTSNSSNNRIEGLQQSINSTNEIELLQVVRTNWSKKDAKDKTIQLFQRFNEEKINLVWTAGDYLAHGAIEAIKQSGLVPGKDVFVAGVDWNESSFQLIRNNEMEFSIGGHFVEAGIAVILAEDYLHGINFREFTGRIIQTKMELMTKDNIDEIESLLDRSNWEKLDLKKLSKYHNPLLSQYEFKLREMLSIEK